MEKDLKDIKRVPLPPDYFDDLSKKYFAEIVKLLMRTKALKDLDMLRVQQLALELSCYEEMTRKIKDHGYVNKHDQVSPYVSIRNKAFQNITTIGKEFGFSWAGRDKMPDRFKGSDPAQGNFFAQLFDSNPADEMPEKKLRKID